MTDCQTQTGGCGLFAIAFATALANDVHQSLTFKQNEMRQHLHSCLTASKMTMFPATSSRRMIKKIKSTTEIPIFCSCCLPEMLSMVQCSECSEVTVSLSHDMLLMQLLNGCAICVHKMSFFLSENVLLSEINFFIIN